MTSLRLGVDVGGTFTDLVAADPATGGLWHHKERSTPDDPARAILDGSAALLAKVGAGATGADVAFFGHGTTVITNMILERKGARLALVTTRGFRDVLDLGRQARPHVYDYRVRRPAALAARADRFEVTERMSASGEVVTALDPSEMARLCARLAEIGYEAVALCFLHGYHAPAHEQQAMAQVQAALPGAYVTASHLVAPEYREFERFATTALNAFVGPRAGRYFKALADGLRDLGITAPLYTVTSNSGLVDVETVRAIPVRTALSGPAAGVGGIGRILAAHELGDLATFDVGGTSTDIAILPGGVAQLARTREVAGHPVLAPMVDIEVIGAGGGSVARLDPGGALRVGPDSAGADPGPAAYRRGGVDPTVTDAAIVLGRIGDGPGFVGDIHIDRAAAEDAVARAVGRPLGLSTAEAAEGILEIATAGMARTIRSASLSRGVEPDRLCLVAYGGAGPLLGADVAMALGITRVIVPVAPGTLCARALLVSDIARDFSVTRLTPLQDDIDLDAAFDEMQGQGAAWLDGEGVTGRAFDRSVECRYQGQNFELAVPLEPGIAKPADLRAAFHRLHEATQGFALPDRAIELVTFRLKARADGCRRAATPAGSPSDAAPGDRVVRFAGQDWDTPVWRRDALRVAQDLQGPAIIEEPTSTTVLPPGWSCAVLADETLQLTREVLA